MTIWHYDSMRHSKTMGKIVTPKRILLSRTDNLGDIVLTLPMAWHLKQHFPECHIAFLSRPYAQELVANCPFIDEVLLYDPKEPTDHLISTLKLANLDIIFHVYPRKDIAFAAKKAGIATRIGTSHRWYHWLTCNKRVSYSRAKSQQHEAELNLNLLTPLGMDAQTTPMDIRFLTPRPRLPKHLQQRLSKTKFNLVLQPLSNGNGREWPMTHFIKLTRALLTNGQYHILINGTPNEAGQLTELIALLPKKEHGLFDLSLDEKIALFSACDGMVSNSTGPMHITAALGIFTLGLFPPKSTMNPQRWKPIGPKATYLVTQKNCQMPCTNGHCACMSDITAEQVVTAISPWLSQKKVVSRH